MALNITLYEETGVPVSGRGTVSPVINFGWKSSGTDDSDHYVYDPILTPAGTNAVTQSYTKVHFFKIDGTYAKAVRPRITISHKQTRIDGYEGYGKILLHYRFMDSYEQPHSGWDGATTFIPWKNIILPDNSVVELTTTTIYPKLSTTGPHTGQQYVSELAANGTYYTQYLVTQLLVPDGLAIGNLGDTEITFEVDEYEV